MNDEDIKQKAGDLISGFLPGYKKLNFGVGILEYINIFRVILPLLPGYCVFP